MKNVWKQMFKRTAAFLGALVMVLTTLPYTGYVLAGNGDPEGELEFEKGTGGLYVSANENTYTNAVKTASMSDSEQNYLEYSVTDGEDIASVDDETGVVTRSADQSGWVTITANEKSGSDIVKSGSYSVAFGAEDLDDFEFENGSDAKTLTLDDDIYGTDQNKAGSASVSDGSVTYKSQNDGIVEVDEEGNITAKSEGGPVTITATMIADDEGEIKGALAQYNVTVKQKDSTFDFDSNRDLYIKKGGTGTSTADGARSVTYKTGDPDIATVTESGGEVTGVDTGTTTIIATIAGDATYGDTSATCQVHVCEPLTFRNGTDRKTVRTETSGTYENPVSSTITDGTAVTYESSDTGIATVDNEGKVTVEAGKCGTVTITATLKDTSENVIDSISYELIFSRELSDTEFKFDAEWSDQTPKALTIDDIYTNEAAKPDDADGAIVYSSNNTDVVTVDENTGEVTAVGAGNAIITATYDPVNGDKYEGTSITYSVKVNKKDSRLTFEKESLENLYLGMKVSAGTAIGNAFSNEVGDGAVTFSSGDTDYVEVDENSGQLTLKRITTEPVTITAKKTETANFKETTATYTLQAGYRPLDNASEYYSLEGEQGNNGWYVGDVTVTAEGDYLISKMPEGPYASSITFYDEETSSRTFYLQYNKADSDYNGAVSEVKATILIDKTKPAGKVKASSYGPWTTLLDTLTYGIYSKTFLMIHADSEDGGSGIDYVKYWISSDHEPKTYDQLALVQDWEEYQDDFSMDPDQDSAVFVKIADKAGNVRYLCTDELLLDSTTPVVTIELPQDSNPVYHETVKANVRVEDPENNDTYSGLKSVRYEVYSMNQLTQSGALYPENDEEGDADWEGTVPVSAEANNSNDVKLWIIAEDLAGNETREVQELKIDITKPKVEIAVQEKDGSASDSVYSNIGKIATIRVTERNFDADRMNIQIVSSAGAAPSISGWTKKAGTGNGDDTVYTATVAFAQSGEYQLQVSGEDAAGNTSNTQSQTAVIDFTAPNVTFALPASDHDVYGGNVAVNVTVKDPVVGNSNSGIKSVTYEVYNMATLTQSGTLYTGASGNVRKEWSGSVTVDAAKNNSNQVEVWITVSDLAGNVTTEKRTIKIDTTQPTVQISYREYDGSVPNSMYSRVERIATIRVTERNFDANRMSIKIDGSAGAAPSISGWTKQAGTGNGDDTVYTTTVTFTQSGTYQLQVSGEDTAGNSSNTLSETVVMDFTMANVNFTLPESEHGIYNGNVTVNVEISDPVVGNSNAGIKEIDYEVLNMSQQTDSGTLYIGDSGEIRKDWSGSITVDAAKNNSNQVEVWISVSDLAGNVNVVKQELWIDVTAPVIEISYDNNNGDTAFTDGVYFNAPRTATVRVTERNFDAQDVNIVITNSDGEVPAISGWSSTSGTGNGDDAVHTATITYKEDGDYTFKISCEDLAGNEAGAANYGNSLAGTAFTIDRTLPTIAVAYDNNNAKNGSYYNQMRTGTITIEEHNFETGRVRVNVTATDNGQNVAAPAITGWTHTGDIHKATIVFSSDALYHLNLSYTDKAGNEAAAYNSEDFYVDQTAPAVTISGIADHSANNDDRIQLTVESTDTNFDTFEVDLSTVVLNDGKFETKKVDGVRTTTGNGARFTVNNLEADGIYTLKCVAVDKAGNAFDKVSLVGESGNAESLSRSSEDTLLMFSVNREGSTFMLDEDSRNLVNDYYVQNVNENIEIVETNADPIKEHELTLNQEVLNEGTDYTVQESGGDGEWYQYVYAVNKELFAEEGEYKLVVSSVDKTDTTAYSDVKDLDISFVIDQTAPTITVSGLQESGRYQTQKQAVTIVPTDDGGKLKSVQVDLQNNGAGMSEVLFDMADQELEDYLAEHSGRVEFEIPEGINMDVVITSRDCARDITGNTNEAVVKYSHVTVSPKGFVIFYANKPLFVGTVAGATTAVGAGAGVSIFTIRRRRFRMIRKK